MLTYFLIFTAIGFAIGRFIPNPRVGFFYMAFISLVWGANSQAVWGLATLGELLLGYFVAFTFFNPSDRDAPIVRDRSNASDATSPIRQMRAFEDSPKQPSGMPPRNGLAAERAPADNGQSAERPSHGQPPAPSSLLHPRGVANPSVSTASQPPDRTPRGTQHCSGCGKELMPSMRFCPNCGARTFATAPIESDSGASPASAIPRGINTSANSVEQTLPQVLEAAKQGDAGAQVLLAARYGRGDGVPQDDREAALWLHKAAEQGHAEAQLLYGFMHATGRGVPQSHAQAAAWYRKAAEQGHADAQASLGVMYAQAEGVPRDDQQAVYWWRKAAEQGEAKAQAGLGCMYSLGHGVSQDYGQAAFWNRKAADQGNAIAQAALGSMYGAGQGVAEDNQQAYFWFCLAAERGYGPARALLPYVENLLAPAQRTKVQAAVATWQPVKSASEVRS